MSSNVSSGKVSCVIFPYSKPYPSFNLEAIVIPQICEKVPQIPAVVQKWKYLENLCLAEPLAAHDEMEIDLLLGVEYGFNDILRTCFLVSKSSNADLEKEKYIRDLAAEIMACAVTKHFFCHCPIDPFLNLRIICDKYLLSVTIDMYNYRIANKIDKHHATRVNANTKSIIDHVLVKQAYSNSCSVIVEENALSDHNGRLLIHLKEEVKLENKKTLCEVKHTDHKNMVKLFREEINTVNIDTFQQHIQLIGQCKKKSEYNTVIKCHNNNLWITKELLDMMAQRDKVYKKKMRNPNDIVAETEFKKLRNKINNKIKLLKHEHFKRKWNETGGSARKQWKLVNSLLKKLDMDAGIESLTVNGVIVEDPVAISNELNKHFTEVGKNIVSEIDLQMQNMVDKLKFNEIHCNNSCYVEDVNEQEVLEILMGLKKTSAPGHDQITLHWLKKTPAFSAVSISVPQMTRMKPVFQRNIIEQFEHGLIEAVIT
ncbi:unnamed protein product [Callosobruchus maculatus]|uniref:Uncharacterized protein n=1 Tax=Callosobruchus maculatus TaxID=64391 RepID=A0A653D122_CALMS|nr:unnamed protein product [Callosobruchus maculatus]